MYATIKIGLFNSEAVVSCPGLYDAKISLRDRWIQKFAPIKAIQGFGCTQTRLLMRPQAYNLQTLLYKFEKLSSLF